MQPTGLRKSELAAIVDTNPENCALTIKRTDDGFWYIALDLLSNGAQYELLTERGGLKSWRDPSAAVKLIEEACPECSKLTIEINGWSFSRTY